jgi:hypothetical protein
MRKRIDSYGVTRCGCPDNIDEQKTCDLFVKNSHAAHCCFLVRGDLCDWNPAMACAPKKKEDVPLQDIVSKHFRGANPNAEKSKVEESEEEEEFDWPY